MKLHPTYILVDPDERGDGATIWEARVGQDMRSIVEDVMRISRIDIQTQVWRIRFDAHSNDDVTSEAAKAVRDYVEHENVNASWELANWLEANGAPLRADDEDENFNPHDEWGTLNKACQGV